MAEIISGSCAQQCEIALVKTYHMSSLKMAEVIYNTRQDFYLQVFLFYKFFTSIVFQLLLLVMLSSISTSVYNQHATNEYQCLYM